MALGFGSLGNGITVWDNEKDDPRTRDYVRIAHISRRREITWYNEVSPEWKLEIEEYAATAHPSVSVSQEYLKVFEIEPLNNFLTKPLKPMSQKTNFFSTLLPLLGGMDVNINIMHKDGKIILSLVPKAKDGSTLFMPLVMTGTEEDLDEGFFAAALAPLETYKGSKLITNAAMVVNSVKAADTKASTTPAAKATETKPKAEPVKPKKPDLTDAQLEKWRDSLWPVGVKNSDVDKVKKERGNFEINAIDNKVIDRLISEAEAALKAPEKPIVAEVEKHYITSINMGMGEIILPMIVQSKMSLTQWRNVEKVLTEKGLNFEKKGDLTELRAQAKDLIESEGGKVEESSAPEVNATSVMQSLKEQAATPSVPEPAIQSGGTDIPGQQTSDNGGTPAVPVIPPAPATPQTQLDLNIQGPGLVGPSNPQFFQTPVADTPVIPLYMGGEVPQVTYQVPEAPAPAPWAPPAPNGSAPWNVPTV